MSEYLNFCLRTYKYTCPRVWGEPFHILRTYVLFYASCLFPVSSKTPPIYFGTPILAPSSKLRPRCGKALMIKIVHVTFYSRECLLLSEGQEKCGRWGGQVLQTPEGFSRPRKEGVQDGRRAWSGQSNNHQPVLAGPRKGMLTQPLQSAKTSHTHSKRDLKTGQDQKPIWSPLVAQAVLLFQPIMPCSLDPRHRLSTAHKTQ